MANSVDQDETQHSAASHLGLYCLLRPVCPNTYGKYGTGVSSVDIDWMPNKAASDWDLHCLHSSRASTDSKIKLFNL